jgi:four helix bundle protein
MSAIKDHHELRVYQFAFESAMQIFELARAFPREETYSLTDQIRRSSRSVCANIVEAWRERRCPASFVSKLSDADTEPRQPKP